MICHESDAMQSVPLTFDRLPNMVTIALDEGIVGTKLKTTLQEGKNGNESKTLYTSMVDERSTTVQPELSMASDRSREEDEDRTGNCGLLQLGSCEVCPEQHFIDGFVDNLLVRMELDETDGVHLMNISAFITLEVLHLERSTANSRYGTTRLVM